MVALVLDLLVAYLLVRYVPRLWGQLILAIPGGIISAIVGNMLIYWAMGDQTPGETVTRMIGSAVWHPIITMLMIWFFRRDQNKDESVEG